MPYLRFNSLTLNDKYLIDWLIINTIDFLFACESFSSYRNLEYIVSALQD